MINARQIINGIKVAVIGISLTLVFNFLAAATWTPPTSNPPLNNASGPLNESIAYQTKLGMLRVGGLTSDTGIFVPTVAVPYDLPADVLMWVGGKVLVTDICLNSNPTKCLSGLP